MTLVAETTSSAAGWLVPAYHDASTMVVTSCGIIIAASIGIVALIFSKFKDVYETEEYGKLMAAMRAVNPDIHPNSPLRNFAILACAAGLVAGLALGLHLTLGRTGRYGPTLACVVVEGVALLMLAVELFALLLNVLAMIRISGRVTEGKIQKHSGRQGATLAG